MTSSGRRAIRRATFFVIPAMALLLTLGTWQVERRAQKHALLAAIEANLAAPPLETLDRDASEFRRVRLTGMLQPARALAMANRLRDGVMGIELVVPLALADGTIVLVDRGWRRALDKDDAAERVETISGMLRRPAAVGWFAPDNQPGRGLWFRWDLPAMAAAAGLPPSRVLPFYVMEDPATLPEIPDNHLQYAVTWYSFAATLLVIYAIFVIRARREGSEP